MGNELRILRDYIKSKGLRNTAEREMILEEIFSCHDHFDVDELYLRLKEKKKQISKASIYRTIPVLIECGLIDRVFFEDGHHHYEHIYGHGHHCHLRCIGCGRIVEFKDKDLLEIEKRLARRYQFKVTYHKLEIAGYCEQCSKGGGTDWRS